MSDGKPSTKVLNMTGYDHRQKALADQLSKHTPIVPVRDNLDLFGLHREIYPFPGGIWVDKDTDDLLIIVYVYLALMEIPETRAEMHECYTKFAGEVGSLIRPCVSRSLKGAIERVRKNGYYGPIPVVRELKEGFPVKTEEDFGKLKVIFKPWADKWALGSENMIAWVIGLCFFNLVGDICGVTISQMQKRQPKAVKGLVDFICQADEQLGRAWRVLLTGEYARAKEATRRVARETVRAHGYYLMRERTLAKWVRLWVLAHSWGATTSMFYSEDVLAQLKLDHLFKIDKVTQSDISKAFKKIDDVLERARKPGAPQGKYHSPSYQH